jgi:CHAD domain-containing protein
MSNIQLTNEQVEILTNLSRSFPEGLLRRARLILAYAEGVPTMLAASNAGISRSRARYWKRQFLLRGMEIFGLKVDNWNSGIQSIVQTEHPGELQDFTTDDTQEEVGITIHDGSIPYPTVQKTIGLNLDDYLAEAGKKIWLFHFAIMLSHEQGALLGEDSEELHDMRVATRRMRTAFEIFTPAFDEKTMQQFRTGLQRVGRALGAVRDMDVILDNGINYQMKIDEANRPYLDPLLNSWKQSIETKRLKLTKQLHSEKYERFKREFNYFLQTSSGKVDKEKIGNGANSRIRDLVPVLIYSRYAAVREYESILPKASISDLHALRIEFKKLRYILEYFKEILGEEAGKAINEIKQYQDHLGELHDADVGCQLVSDFLENWEDNQTSLPIQDRLNPEPIVTYLATLHAERYRKVTTFYKRWQYFNRVEFRQSLAQAISVL